MDIARDEQDKTPNEISVEKLQSLLDLALRSTAAAADPLHEDGTCSVDTCSLLKRLSILKDLQTGETVSEADAVQEPLIMGMETFSVNYKLYKDFKGPSVGSFCLSGEQGYIKYSSAAEWGTGRRIHQRMD